MILLSQKNNFVIWLWRLDGTQKKFCLIFLQDTEIKKEGGWFG